MLTQLQRDLITRLIVKTSTRQAIWGKTSRPDEYKLELKSSTITTDKWTDDEETKIDLSILNDRGERIEYVQASEVREYADFNELLELHSAARRSYFKVEETFKGILEELNNETNVGRESPRDDLPF